MWPTKLLLWALLCSLSLTAATADARRRHRDDAVPTNPIGVRELRQRLDDIRSKVTLGQDATDDCGAVSKLLSEVATDPSPQARAVVADAVKFCALDVPIARAERRLKLAAAAASAERARSEPDLNAPCWGELASACDDAQKTKTVAASSFSTDPKVSGLADDIATDCSPASVEAPAKPRPSVFKILLLLMLFSGCAALVAYGFTRRVAAKRPAAQVVAMRKPDEPPPSRQPTKKIG